MMRDRFNRWLWLKLAAGWRRNEQRWLLLAEEAHDNGLPSASARGHARHASAKAITCQARADSLRVRP